MNKKILIASGILAPATLATSISVPLVIHKDTVVKNPSLKHQSVLIGSDYFLKNGNNVDSTKTVKSLYYSKEDESNIEVIDSIDFIKSPSNIAIDKIGVNIFNKIKFIKDFQDVYVNGSSMVKVSFDDNTWAVDKLGNILTFTKGSKTTMTISVGSVSKDITVLQRAEIINKKFDNFDSIDSIVKAAKPDNGVWGTKTTTDYGKFPETGDVNVLKVNMSDVVEAGGKTKAYGRLIHLNADPAHQIKFDSTVNYIAIKLYIPQDMVNTVWWFRSYYGGFHDNIDLNKQTFVPDHSGWYTFSAPVDHLKFTKEYTTLTDLKFLQMVTDHNALSGSIYVEGMYASDKEIKDL